MHLHDKLLLVQEAPQIAGYLQDWRQYALGVLHIVTLVPQGRKKIIEGTSGSNRDGISIILDVASSLKYEVVYVFYIYTVNCHQNGLMGSRCVL